MAYNPASSSVYLIEPIPNTFSTSLISLISQASIFLPSLLGLILGSGGVGRNMSSAVYSNIAKCDLYGMAATANTNLLASDATSTQQPNSIWLIYAETSAVGNILLKRTQTSTGYTSTAKINIPIAGIPLWANILVAFGETINFQVDTNMTLQRFNISEIAPITINPSS